MLSNDLVDKVFEHLIKIHEIDTQKRQPRFVRFLNSAIFKDAKTVINQLETEWILNRFPKPNIKNNLTCNVNGASEILDQKVIAKKGNDEKNIEKLVFNDVMSLFKKGSEIFKDDNNISPPSDKRRGRPRKVKEQNGSLIVLNNVRSLMKMKTKPERRGHLIKMKKTRFASSKHNALSTVPVRKKRKQYKRKKVCSSKKPGLKKSNYSSLKCAFCPSCIFNCRTSLKKHSLQHLPEKTGVCWLYQCSLCLNVGQQPLRTLYFDTIERHVRMKHKVVPVKHVHYVDTSETYSAAIESTFKMCFSDFLGK